MKFVSKAVIIKKNKYLLQLRDNKKNILSRNHCAFFGGGIEKNETAEQCIRRELKEELCINSMPGDILCESVYEYDHGEFKIIAILTDLASEDFDLKIHDKLEWVDIRELLNYELLQADIPIAEKIISKFGLTN